MLTTKRCSVCNSKVGCSHSQVNKNTLPASSSAFQEWDESFYNFIHPHLSSEITEPDKLLLKINNFKNDTEDNMSLNENQSFIKCHFCSSEVIQDWFTKHIADHIKNRYAPPDSKIRIADISANKSSNNDFKKEDFVKVNKEDVEKFFNIIPVPKIKDKDVFAFRKVKDISAFSSVSKTGRYSDFNLLIWFAESTSSYQGAYAGGHNSFYGKSCERLQIHLTYDSLEKYFTISGRIYKRNGYSDFDVEEGAIPDQVCEQDELLDEIRKILLFFRVSPKETYRRFKKTVNRGLQIEHIDGDSLVSTANHSSILDEVKKGKFVYHTPEHYYHGID